MTTTLDTNMLVALWNEDELLNSAVKSAMRAALAQGNLVIAAPVFAELVASPARDEAFVDEFLARTGVTVDWNLSEEIWREAGRAFHAHSARRPRQGGPAPRRILADFVIGAHALQNGFPLLTLDQRFYRAAFPRLVVSAV
jgi:predicted nucleic acid-binding protein